MLILCAMIMVGVTKDIASVKMAGMETSVTSRSRNRIARVMISAMKGGATEDNASVMKAGTENSVARHCRRRTSRHQIAPLMTSAIMGSVTTESASVRKGGTVTPVLWSAAEISMEDVASMENAITTNVNAMMAGKETIAMMRSHTV